MLPSITSVHAILSSRSSENLVDVNTARDDDSRRKTDLDKASNIDRLISTTANSSALHKIIHGYHLVTIVIVLPAELIYNDHNMWIHN
jgi:hypothetical protein